MNDTALPRLDAGVGAIVRTTRDTALTPRNFAEAMEFSKMLASSDMIPPGYRGKPANIMLVIQWGGEIGLSPLQAIQSVANINGKFAVYGDALLAIVRGSPLCEDVIETYEGAGESLTAVCVAHRRGSAPVTHRFSVADAKKARLWGKAGPWTEYPKRMLQWRARGFALRDAFPDVLRGVVTIEEARDTPTRGMVDVTPPASADVTADLDSFAAVPDSPPVEGNPVDIHPDFIETNELDTEARITASLGTKTFTTWWNTATIKPRRHLIREHLPEYRALCAVADAPPAEDPFGLPPNETVRDEEWWAQPHLVIEAGAPITFLAVLEGRLKEARTAGEVTALREDNEAIDELPKDIKEAVLGALLAREAELKGMEKAHG